MQRWEGGKRRAVRGKAEESTEHARTSARGRRQAAPKRADGKREGDDERWPPAAAPDDPTTTTTTVYSCRPTAVLVQWSLLCRSTSTTGGGRRVGVPWKAPAGRRGRPRPGGRGMATWRVAAGHQGREGPCPCPCVPPCRYSLLPSRSLAWPVATILRPFCTATARPPVALSAPAAVRGPRTQIDPRRRCLPIALCSPTFRHASHQ